MRPAGERRPSSRGPAAGASAPDRRRGECSGMGRRPGRVDLDRSRWHGRAMSTVVLSGATDSLGRRVATALSQLEAVEGVIALDDHDLHTPDLKRRIEGADAVIHLSGGVDETRAVL